MYIIKWIPDFEETKAQGEPRWQNSQTTFPFFPASTMSLIIWTECSVKGNGTMSHRTFLQKRPYRYNQIFLCKDETDLVSVPFFHAHLKASWTQLFDICDHSSAPVDQWNLSVCCWGCSVNLKVKEKCFRYMPVCVIDQTWRQHSWILPEKRFVKLRSMEKQKLNTRLTSSHLGRTY